MNQTNESMNQTQTPDLRRTVIHNLHRLRSGIKWILIAIVTGLLIGGVGIAFSYAMSWATASQRT